MSSSELVGNSHTPSPESGGATATVVVPEPVVSSATTVIVQSGSDDSDDQPGISGAPAMSTWEVASFGVVTILFSILLLYFLAKLWPGGAELEKPLQPDRITFFFGTLPVWPETRLLLIALLSGALGSFVHLATSFADFAGNNRLVRSWIWWYILRPFIGANLAWIFYVAIRGGLISGGASAASLSCFGVAALSAFTGMFSKQATDKLREVFDVLVKTAAPPRSDALQSSPGTERTAVTAAR